MALTRWYREVYLQGRHGNFGEGYKEGYAKGRLEIQRKWEEWNNRRESAAARGEKFTKPPPSLNENGKTP